MKIEVPEDFRDTVAEIPFHEQSARMPQATERLKPGQVLDRADSATQAPRTGTGSMTTSASERERLVEQLMQSLVSEKEFASEKTERA